MKNFLIRHAAVVGAAVLTAALTAACDTSGDDTADSTAAGGLQIVEHVPDDETDEHFAERIVYPVKSGTPDPEENWADLYVPTGMEDSAEGTVPLVVYIQGTGWHGGAHGASHVASDLAARGVAVVNIEYRGVREGAGWPETFEEVAAALDHIPAVGGHYPQLRIADATVVGHSAGGQLAAWAGFRSSLDDDEVGADPAFTPTRVVSLAGPLDLIRSANTNDDNIVKAMQGTPDELPEEYDSIDPIRNINSRIPVVAVHGTEDTVVPKANSERYVDAVNNTGGTAELVLFEGEDHLSFLKPRSAHYRQLLEIIHDTATVPRDALDGSRFD